MANHYQDYRGRKIELRGREREVELRVDSQRLPFGQLVNGQYFLYKYAYDWSDSLTDLAAKYIDHQVRADKVRAASKLGEER